MNKAMLRSPFRKDYSRGSALVITLGVMMVGAVIIVTLAAAAYFNSQNTSSTRVKARALQSVDAGIDMVQSMIAGKTYGELDQVCGSGISNLVINADTVVITTKFKVTDSSGATSVVECPAPGDITSELEVTSTATTAPTLATDGAVTRSVRAVFYPTPPTVTLDKAIFSESDLDIGSATNLLPSGAVDSSGHPLKDANVYANGTVICENNVSTGGSIYATDGDLVLVNICTIDNTVWVSGKVDMSKKGTVSGDVIAASTLTGATPAVDIGMQGEVTGSILTNGDIVDAGTVGKSLLSNKQITVSSAIGGSAYAGTGLVLDKGTIQHDGYTLAGNISGTGTINGNAKYAGTIAATNKVKVLGTSIKGGTSAPNPPNPAQTFNASYGYVGSGLTVQAPPREQMPMLTMNAADIATWEAAGYTTETYNGVCTASQVDNAVTSGTWSSSGRLMIFEGCSTPVSFGIKTMTLPGDLAIVSKSGISTTGGNLFWGGDQSDPSQFRKLYLIVPWDTPNNTPVAVGGGQFTPSCSNPTVGNIYIDPQLKLTDLNILAYTPCKFEWKAAVSSAADPWTGQVYAGNVQMNNSFDLQMASVPVPSLLDGSVNESSPAGMRLTSRFDISG